MTERITTPRDAIAGLSERLRFDATRCELHFSKGVASNIDEAATQLDALQARVKELEAAYALQNNLLASQTQQITDCRTINDAAFAQMRHAEQQRDEAYERAAKVAELAGCGNRACLSCYGNQIAAAIRRLASGPEGGAKPPPQESKP